MPGGILHVGDGDRIGGGEELGLWEVATNVT